MNRREQAEGRARARTAGKHGCLISGHNAVWHESVIEEFPQERNTDEQVQDTVGCEMP